ncbi:mas-related G-protein coupled receptor member H-like [Elgaria multicarinata webbii]|uniref:mas-related G-protein coupled receptor member H-like n=1 Tax=Elgaria multicarinata webbii TaxID=159646 RepID=UPI002FCCF7D2
MKRFHIENNVSNYDQPYQTPMIIWNVYECIINKRCPPGDLESRPSPFPNLNGSTETGHQINSTNRLPFSNLSEDIINSFIVVVCLLGLLGNGIVFWILGFRLKRNHFTTYILNLSIADFGVLITLLSTATFALVVTLYNVLSLFFLLFLELFFFTYSTSQFLLAAISIDRCVAVLFPLWHRCRRPPRLSTFACALIWIFSFLLSGIHFTLQMTGRIGNAPLFFQLIVNALLCTPLMVISTLTLFIHVCCKSKQWLQGKLVTAILLALLLFLLFAFPINAFYIIYSYYAPNPILMLAGFACASLNSSINPLIYFLVGSRQKKGKLRMSMKVAFQRVFSDAEELIEEQSHST